MSKFKKISSLPINFLHRFGLAKYFNYSTSVQLEGTNIKVVIPQYGGEPASLLKLRRGFKGEIFEMLKQKADISCFVDIGANIGQSMIEVFAHYPQVQYIGFEPNPDAFFILSMIAEVNKINAELLPWACSNEAKPLQLFESVHLDSGATVIPSIRPNLYTKTKGRWVASYPFDHIASRLNIPQNFVLKIDVEGAENEVIAGAQQTIRHKKPFILCEVLHAHREDEIEENDRRKSQLERLLKDLGYSINLLKLNPQDMTQILGIETLNEFPKKCRWKHSPHTCDYIFTPNEIR